MRLATVGGNIADETTLNRTKSNDTSNHHRISPIELEVLILPIDICGNKISDGSENTTFSQ